MEGKRILRNDIRLTAEQRVSPQWKKIYRVSIMELVLMIIVINMTVKLAKKSNHFLPAVTHP